MFFLYFSQINTNVDNNFTTKTKKQMFIKNNNDENFIIISQSVKNTEIEESLIEIINFQINRYKIDSIYNDLLLWINETNGYVSCHWYNFENKETNENDIFSCLELPELFENIDYENNEEFQTLVKSYLIKIDKDKLHHLIKIKIYITSEINEPKLLLEL